MEKPTFFTGLKPEQLSQAKTFRVNLNIALGQATPPLDIKIR